MWYIHTNGTDVLPLDGPDWSNVLRYFSTMFVQTIFYVWFLSLGCHSCVAPQLFFCLMFILIWVFFYLVTFFLTTFGSGLGGYTTCPSNDWTSQQVLSVEPAVLASFCCSPWADWCLHDNDSVSSQRLPSTGSVLFVLAKPEFRCRLLHAHNWESLVIFLFDFDWTRLQWLQNTLYKSDR